MEPYTTPDSVARSRQAADLLRATGIDAVVVDCESGRMSLGLAVDLGLRLGARYVKLDEVAASRLVDVVHESSSGGSGGSSPRGTSEGRAA